MQFDVISTKYCVTYSTNTTNMYLKEHRTRSRNLRQTTGNILACQLFMDIDALFS